MINAFIVSSRLTPQRDKQTNNFEVDFLTTFSTHKLNNWILRVVVYV